MLRRGCSPESACVQGSSVCRKRAQGERARAMRIANLLRRPRCASSLRVSLVRSASLAVSVGWETHLWCVWASGLASGIRQSGAVHQGEKSAAPRSSANTRPLYGADWRLGWRRKKRRHESSYHQSGTAAREWAHCFATLACAADSAVSRRGMTRWRVPASPSAYFSSTCESSALFIVLFALLLSWDPRRLGRITRPRRASRRSEWSMHGRIRCSHSLDRRMPAHTLSIRQRNDACRILSASRLHSYLHATSLPHHACAAVGMLRPSCRPLGLVCLSRS